MLEWLQTFLKNSFHTQLPSKVEILNTDGQGHPISVYFIWKIRNLKPFLQVWMLNSKEWECQKVEVQGHLRVTICFQRNASETL